ncbi:MAG: hypothetical protein RLZ28_1344 [Actinomycetota bacterium]
MQIDGGLPQIGHHLTLISLGNGYTYDETLFNAMDAARRLIKYAAGDVHWHAKWKASGRASALMGCAQAQKRQEHKIFDWMNGFAVCSCGFALGDMSERALFYLSPGHIDVETKQLVTFFAVRVLSDKADDRLKYFCQSCGFLGLAALDENGAVDLVALAEARAKHVCAR